MVNPVGQPVPEQYADHFNPDPNGWDPAEALWEAGLSIPWDPSQGPLFIPRGAANAEPAADLPESAYLCRCYRPLLLGRG